MPAADAVLSWATSVANEWRWLAIAWHAALGALLIAIVRLHPPQRRVGVLLAVPVASVALIATISGNPFNALMFVLLTAVLLFAAGSLPAAPSAPPSIWWATSGTVLLAVGWLYPHFLVTGHWAGYAYASPFGLLPCPTLLGVIGVTLLAGLRTTRWIAALSAAGLLYGAIGVFRLGVALDTWLLLGAVVLPLLVAAGVAARSGTGLRAHPLGDQKR